MITTMVIGISDVTLFYMMKRSCNKAYCEDVF